MRRSKGRNAKKPRDWKKGRMGGMNLMGGI